MKKLLFSTGFIFAFLPLWIHAQIKNTVVSNPTLYQLVNIPGAKTTVAKTVNDMSSGAIGTVVYTGPALDISVVNIAGKSFSIHYGVPVQVALDKYFLLQEMDVRIGEKISLLNTWVQYNLKSPSKPAVDMIKLIEADLNKLNLSYQSAYARELPPFSNAKLTVRTDARFYPPISNALGFIRANEGKVNESGMYSNIRFDEIYRSPISGVLIIYKK